MREVMKWSKDYRTGEVVTEKAYKPDNVKGKATIQVKDASGNLVQEVVSENIIIPPMASLPNPYYEQMYQSLMNSTSYVGGILYDSTYSAFSTIILSDNDDMEDENNFYYKGNVIGWCVRDNQNPGTDVKGGSYNPTESYTEYEDGYYHAHLVYDFNTSQGNGEFNSIWWSPSVRRSSSSPGFYNSNLPFKLTQYTFGYRPYKNIQPNNFKRNQLGEICKVADNKYYKLLNVKNAINCIEAPKFEIEPGTGASGRSSVFSFNNGQNWVSATVPTLNNSYSLERIKNLEITINKYGTDDTITASKTYNMWETFTEIQDYIERSANLYDSTYFNVYPYIVNDEGILYFRLDVYNYSSSGGQTHPTIDSSSNIIPNSSRYGYYLMSYDCNNMAWKIKPGATFESLGLSRYRDAFTYAASDKLKVDKNKYALIAQGLLVITDFDNMTSYYYNYENYTINGSTVNSSSLQCFGPYNTILTNSSQYNYIMVRGYNAHTKLPNTVTKTSADTMKIQYDYYIQIPYALTDDGNYIPPLD